MYVIIRVNLNVINFKKYWINEILGKGFKYLSILVGFISMCNDPN